VVIVPVANPDGYQETRSPTGDRSWRGNMDVSYCGRGVNLNRNMTATFQVPANGSDISCASGNDNYTGSAISSENEALEKLLAGDFGGHRIAWADMLLYPSGFKPTTDSDGPKCNFLDDQCFSPDFALYRDVFGDTHSDLWVDRQSLSPSEFPFFRDHGVALLYSVSGDTKHGVANSLRFPALSVTPELPGSPWDFYVECESDHDDIIASIVEDQKDVVRRVVSAAPGLVTSDPVAAWGPNHIGAFASGIWVREYNVALGNQQQVRASFTKSVWAPIDSGTLTAQIDMMPYTYARGRPGVEYNLYFLGFDSGAFDPLELPCEISSSNAADVMNVDGAPDCEGTINLCDGSRLPASGFTLIDDERGGERDCWWEATSHDDTLVIPAGATPYGADTTHCHFTFSLQWGALEGSIEVERDNSGLWERVFAVSPGAPYYSFPQYPQPGRLHSYAFEANDNLPSSTQAFRIRLVGDAEPVRVFDPVVYCRGRGLP
jgi:hypothetical protein